MVGDIWTVEFKTYSTGKEDLIIEAFDSTHFDIDLEPVSLKCGDEDRRFSVDGDVLISKDWECGGSGYFSVKVLTPGIHVLKFIYGTDSEFAFNEAIYEEKMSSRGLTWIDYDIGFGKHKVIGSLTALNYFDGTEFTPIEPSIVSYPYVDNLYDWMVENGVYHAYFKEDPLTSETIRFYFDEIKYGTQGNKKGYVSYQPMSINYRNVLDQIQYISGVLSTQGFPDGGLFSYPSVFGNGYDLMYDYTNSVLTEKLVIKNKSDLFMPEQYILDGGNITLDLDEIIVWKDELDIYIDGEKWDKKSKKKSDKIVEFKLGNKTLFYLPIPYAWETSHMEEKNYTLENGTIITEDTRVESKIRLEREFKKSGNKLYIILKTPYDWLNSSARVYPLTIDSSTGFYNPGSNGQFYTTWTNPTNAYSSDEVFAQTPKGTTDCRQDFYNFGFNVPTGATINGIEVTLEMYADKADRCYIKSKIGWNDQIGDVSDDEKWLPLDNYMGTSEDNYTAGNSTDVWGSHVWNTTETNDYFNTRHDTACLAGSPVYVYIDNVRANIYYTSEADTCTYGGSGDWNIDCSDKCVITSPVDVGNNNINIFGSGTLTLDAEIRSEGTIQSQDDCFIMVKF